MRCLFGHKWFLGKAVDVTSDVRAVLYYRRCERCGKMQRGLDTFSGDIPWETVRERSYLRAKQIPILRQPSSRFDRLAHWLGLRRSRTSDERDQKSTPRSSKVNQLQSDREQHTPFVRPRENLMRQLRGPEMIERPAEKRRNKRVGVAVPVILENATGVTRDVSTSGVFFWKRGTFIYGESISFSMERKTESGKFMLKCRGVVARTEPRGDDVGVAVRITKTVMEPIKDVMAQAEGLSDIRPGNAG
jgi:hypothetical protein